MKRRPQIGKRILDLALTLPALVQRYIDFLMMRMRLAV